MTLTKKQRLEAYMYAYFCVLAGFDENGDDVEGFKKQYVCDYLLSWVEEEIGNTKDDQEMLFPEWYIQRPKSILLFDSLGWWPQNSIKRINALKRAITLC